LLQITLPFSIRSNKQSQSRPKLGLPFCNSGARRKNQFCISDTGRLVGRGYCKDTVERILTHSGDDGEFLDQTRQAVSDEDLTARLLQEPFGRLGGSANLLSCDVFFIIVGGSEFEKNTTTLQTGSGTEMV